jgi:ribonuclease-3
MGGSAAGGDPDRRAAAVEALQDALGWRFADAALLERALTHASVGDGARKTADNERLEFLGDRVLGLVVAETLMALDPPLSEGEMAPRLNRLVSRAACAEVARRIGLGPALRLSGAETKTGGRDKDSILAGAMEAVLAAVFQEGGLEAARPVIADRWRETFAGLDAPDAKDVKTRLQEWAQGAGRPLPSYAVTGRGGPDHAPTFTVEVRIKGVAPQSGQGPSRQAAEKAAATALLAREKVGNP